MSWLLKHRKKDGKYRIWTTISDGWITDWLSEDEIKEYLRWREYADTKLKVIEHYMTFPAGWHDKDTHKPLSLDKSKFYDWQLNALKKGAEEYEKEIDRKYEELTSHKV